MENHILGVKMIEVKKICDFLGIQMENFIKLDKQAQYKAIARYYKYLASKN